MEGDRASSAVPRLAVVGHPNKGKSSLVATLAEDDSVSIGRDPGTTIESRAYPLRIDGRPLYTLIDTPGFQRARRVLAWLQERARREGATAADRPRLVAGFVAEPSHAARFPDECELLRPIVDGAGILYVVDGGVPYGPEYEAEMEILRWTGRPSMALINPIGKDDHVGPWQVALGQFFRVVRVVDAVEADHDTRRRLLLAFGELEADWRDPIETAVAALDEVRVAHRRQSAREIAELMADALSLVVEKRLGPEEDPSDLEAGLEQEYKRRLVRLEATHRKAIQRIHGHHGLEARGSELEVLESDLFSQGTWLRFGLRRRDLAAAGAAGGAATGGTIDLALGGTSLLLGVTTGAMLGGVLGWLGATRLAGIRIVHRPLGGRLARFGPSRNPGFAFVLFGRARHHRRLVASRTHAVRETLDLGETADERLPLDTAMRKRLEKSFAILRTPDLPAVVRADETEVLVRTIEAILDADDSRSGKKRSPDGAGGYFHDGDGSLRGSRRRAV